MALEKLLTKYFGEKINNEVQDSLTNYWPNLKKNVIEMLPATMAAFIGTYFGQIIGNEIFFNNLAMNSVSGYVGGALTAYPTYFGIVYYRNKNEFTGKEKEGKFKKYIFDFMMADWTADALAYSPTFGTIDQILQRTSTFEPGTSGTIANAVAIIPYIFLITAFLPVFEKISEKTNKKITDILINPKISSPLYNLLLNSDKLPAVHTTLQILT